MSRISALLKAVPLCCGLMFIAAAEDECTIRIVTDDDNDGCEDVEDVCNLDCELATNDEGCAICECADDPPPTGCEDDGDCGDGQVCEFLEACPPCADGNEPGQCDAPCTFEGVCVDVQPDPCAAVLCSPDTYCAVDESGEAVCLPIDERQCASDADCGGSAFCDFSTCGQNDGGEAPPAPPDDGGNGGGGDIACLGKCVEIAPIGCENVLCEEGTQCVEGFNGPECVPTESECESDADCQGGRCEILCLPMPDCPNCDACLVIGQCVEDDICAALCGPGQECTINEDGSVGCTDVRPGECTSDEECATGNCNAGEEVCLPDPACEASDNGLVACSEVCFGYCVEPAPASCVEDAECADGEVCVVSETCLPFCDPNTPDCGQAPCFVEGHCAPADGTDPDQPPQP